MLDEFSLEQPIVYKTLINSIKKDKCSHAYLIETNGYTKSFDLALSFAKYLLCPNNYSDNTNCNKCNICKNVDKRELLDLKIIDAEGQWIKKSQLDELQYDFSKKSMTGNKQIYIINGANKLNASSSNSLLKFLEEPEEGIIAILIVDNKEELLDTIISRCQILSLKKDKKQDNLNTLELIANNLFNSKQEVEDYLNNENSLINIEKVIEFIEYYEENHTQTIIYLNKLWNDHFKEKKDLYNAFTILLLFYKDLLNLKLNRNIEVFKDYVNNLNKIEKNNTINALTHKLNVIMNLREKIKFNANSNLLMDKLIISLEGCEDL